MNEKKLKEIAKVLSGLSYREFQDVFQKIEPLYHVTKKELTSDEISSAINRNYR